jgi:hypothetical protein
MAENAYEYCAYSKNTCISVRYYVKNRCSQPATDKLSRCKMYPPARNSTIAKRLLLKEIARHRVHHTGHVGNVRLADAAHKPGLALFCKHA